MSSPRDNAAPASVLQSLREAGEISFARFMALALYGPDGYYAAHPGIGLETADFYTAAQSRLFARTVANAAVDYWVSCGKPSRFQIVEFGGGTGEFAANLWAAVSDKLTAVRLAYHTVEVSALLRAAQRERMAVVSPETADVLHQAPAPSVPAFLVGNEVLDALPVESVRRQQGGWQQAYVHVASDGELALSWRDAPEPTASFARQYIDCPSQGRAEACLGYPSFFFEAFAMVEEGHLVLFDYGITTAEWRSGVRPQGTLRAYRQHQLVDPLQAPGLSDMTADVNWDAAEAAMRAAGFDEVAVVPQGNYLVSHGIVQLAEEVSHHTPEAARRTTNALKHLVLPGGMGERFSVLQGRKTRRSEC